MPTILPTHHCFDDTAEFINERAKTGDRAALLALRLVHGIIRFPDDQPGGGTRAAHAWVEEGDAVYDFGLLDGERVVIHYTRAVFYERLRVEAPTVYTALQLVQHHDATGSSGPWRDDLRQLLRGICDDCDGRGEVLDAPGHVLDGRAYWDTCPTCQGTGKA